MLGNVGIKRVMPDYEKILHSLYEGPLSLSTRTGYATIELEVPRTAQVLKMAEENKLYLDPREWVGLKEQLKKVTSWRNLIYTLSDGDGKLCLMCYGPGRVPTGPVIRQQIAGARPDRPPVSLTKLVREMISNHQNHEYPKIPVSTGNKVNTIM